MTEALTIAAAPLPDWSIIDEEILCPLCDYNLRGLPEPRCPECGYRFDWPDLFDPTRRKHPFVFEHHPKRNAWSFYRTVRAGFRPTRFWHTLYPSQPTRPVRLALYLMLVFMCVASGSLVSIPRQAAALAATYRDDRAQMRKWLADPANAQRKQLLVFATFKTEDEFVEFYAPHVFTPKFARQLFQRRNIDSWSAVLIAVFATWPVLTLLSLSIFQWSMRRVRIRTTHVFRCVAYTFDVAIFATIGFLSAAVIAAKVTMFRGSGPDPFDIVALFVLASFVAMTYRLYVAYDVYLRFDHPLATAVASQVIVGFVMLKMVSWVLLGA